MNISFNELRDIKDRLPDGTMKEISNRLGVSVETVRNYFGGANYSKGEVVSSHFEKGPNGGYVYLHDTGILKMAEEYLEPQMVN